jgi:hypothetical protein
VNVGRIFAAVAMVNAADPGASGAPPSGRTGEGTAGRIALRFTFDGEQPRALVDASGNGFQGAVVGRNGGKVRWVPGRDGTGHAARFPNLCPRPDCRQPTAVIEVDGARQLDPAGASFAFGAAVNVKQLSAGANVLQKGHFADPVQWKLQVDNGFPSCVIHDGRRRVIVRSPVELAPRQWYDLECRKDRGFVAILVNGSERARGKTQLGPLSSRAPLFIGAKGAGKSNNDQFHGILDNVFVRLSR